MKKIASIFLLSMIALCTAFAQETVSAVALQKDTALWNEKEPGMMEWAKKDLEPGTILEVYVGSKRNSQGKKIPDIISSSWTTATKKGQTLDFIKVKYQGKDYYAISNRVALYQTPAVVTKNAATYLTPNLADVRKTSLSYGTVVAIGEERSVCGISLYELSYYDEANYRIRVGYIMKSKVSTAKDDITALKLLKQAIGLTDEKRREAMLDSIYQLSISGAVQDLLDKLNEEPEPEPELEPESEESSGIETVELSEGERDRCIISDDDSNINVRNAPVNGSVIGQLSDGTPVTAYERTAATYDVGDLNNFWYRIDDGAGTEGWVFGSYCPLKAEW